MIKKFSSSLEALFFFSPDEGGHRPKRHFLCVLATSHVAFSFPSTTFLLFWAQGHSNNSEAPIYIRTIILELDKFEQIRRLQIASTHYQLTLYSSTILLTLSLEPRFHTSISPFRDAQRYHFPLLSIYSLF